MKSETKYALLGDYVYSRSFQNVEINPSHRPFATRRIDSMAGFEALAVFHDTSPSGGRVPRNPE
jgi:hypothetical protein